MKCVAGEQVVHEIGQCVKGRMNSSLVNSS